MTQKELHDLVWSKFPICGCGEPGEIVRFLFEMLELRGERWCVEGDSSWWKTRDEDMHNMYNVTIDSPFYWLAFYLLDHLNLAEHGTTARCFWPTDLGREFMEAVRKYGTDPNNWNDEE